MIAKVVFYKRIAKVKAYEAKKGENLATKEDIDIITNKIEAIKDSYNKSLESHKMELQKDFESEEYIMKICQSIDHRFITLIVECLNEKLKSDSIYSGYSGQESIDDDLLKKIIQLERFLVIYKIRYHSNLKVKRLS